MVNKKVKRGFPSLVIRELQFKSQDTIHTTIQAKTKSLIISTGENMTQKKNSYTTGNSVKRQNHLGKHSSVLHKVEPARTCDLALPQPHALYEGQGRSGARICLFYKAKLSIL